MSASAITDIVESQGVMVLDGGLATALESRGCDLNDPLWSARILIDSPDEIRRVHLDFLAAGADCITTASYQASQQGFRERGLSDDEGSALMRLSVELAMQARDEFWSDPGNRDGRVRPLVAASIGPYGAYLADGSEYVGDYDVDRDALYAFHEPRWKILADSGADVLACETIPSAREADVLLRLLDEAPHVYAWMSFTCRDGAHLSDGSRLVDTVRVCDAIPRVTAIGVNCTAPELITGLIAKVRSGTAKPVIVYPNSGESYDAKDRAWHDSRTATDWKALAGEWMQAGASCIGGCCRVTAVDVAVIRQQVIS